MPTKNKLPNLAPKLPAKGKCRVMKTLPVEIIEAAEEAYASERSPQRWDGVPWGECGRRNHRLAITAALQVVLDRYAVASLSPEAEEARVEAGAKAIARAEGWLDNWGNFPESTADAIAQAKAVLASAGLLAGGKK